MKSNLAGLYCHRNGCYLKTDTIKHIPFQSDQCDFPSQQPPRSSGGCTANPATLVWKCSTSRSLHAHWLMQRTGYRVSRCVMKPWREPLRDPAWASISPQRLQNLALCFGGRATFSNTGQNNGCVQHLHLLKRLTQHVFGMEASKDLGLNQERLKPLMDPLRQNGWAVNVRYLQHLLPQAINEDHVPLKRKRHMRKLKARDEKKHMNSSEYGLLNKH